VLKSRLEMSKSHPAANRREGRIAQQLSSKTLWFLSIFSEALCFCSNLLTLLYTSVKNTFNTFKWFSANPAKNVSLYSTGVLS
jgi:hypothetical protein